MAIVGVLSTQLLHHQFIANGPPLAPPVVTPKTIIDKLAR
jgi:hypothetical protein